MKQQQDTAQKTMKMKKWMIYLTTTSVFSPSLLSLCDTYEITSTDSHPTSHSTQMLEYKHLFFFYINQVWDEDP